MEEEEEEEDKEDAPQADSDLQKQSNESLKSRQGEVAQADEL